MGIKKCGNPIDKTGLELTEHGSMAFPIACYHDDLTKYPVEWHWHEELELFLVTEGSAIVAVEGERYIVKEGDGFFVNSGVLHGCWNYGEKVCRFHSVVFHPRLVGGDMESIFWGKYINPVIKNVNLKSIFLKKETEWQLRILEKIEHTWKLCESEMAGYELDVRMDLSKILYEIAETDKSGSHLSEKKQKNSFRMKQMLDYINTNYADNITIEVLGNYANISESECLRCFRNTIGTTPIQYLKIFRIKKAAEWLSSTDMKIVDIGVACGFQDMSYFAKTFKQVYGVTPSEYRKDSAIL